MFLSAFFFCLMTVFVKSASLKLGTMQIVLVRGIFTFFFTFVLLKTNKVSLWGRSYKILVLRGITGSIALYFVYESIQRLSLYEATSIQYLYPIFTTILASVILSEKVYKKIFLSVILGFLGVFVLLKFPFIYNVKSISVQSLIIALSGAFLTALAYVLVRLASKKNESPFLIMFYFPLFTIPMSLPFAIFEWQSPNLYEWCILLMVGICTQLGQMFLTFGYKVLPASNAALTSYIQVPLSALFGYILFFESISYNFIFGSMIIFISIAMVVKK